MRQKAENHTSATLVQTFSFAFLPTSISSTEIKGHNGEHNGTVYLKQIMILFSLKNVMLS